MFGRAAELAFVRRGDSDTLEVEAGDTARRLKAEEYGSNRSESFILRLPGRDTAFAHEKAEDGEFCTMARVQVSVLPRRTIEINSRDPLPPPEHYGSSLQE